MTFLHPWVLLLLAVPAILLWLVPTRGWGLALPFDHGAHKPRRMLKGLLTAMECVPALLLAAAIGIAAGPQVLKQPKNKRELTNIQFCVDVSGSMTIDNRYDMAKEAIASFVKARDGDAFGLTLFGSHAIRWMPLTRDLSAISNSLPFANPANQPIHMSGTRIGHALRFCLGNMVAEADSGDRLIILVSDGASSDLGDGFSEGDIAEELADAKITLYHIHVASDEIPSDVVDIAQRTGGEAFQAGDPVTLRKVFDHIDRMRPAKFNPLGTVPMDHFRPFALVALALVGLHVIGLLGVRYTPW